MARVAVVLSGCGHLDGAEIRESVLALLYLDQQGAQVSIFAPEEVQADEIDHATGKPTGAKRNVYSDAARLARGSIQPLTALDAGRFNALVMPGGYGAAKNLSTFATDGKGCGVLPELQAVIRAFYQQKKPIAAICIAPAVLTAALKGVATPTVTIGDSAGVAEAIQAMGGRHRNCATDACVADEANLLVTCPAYMRDDPLKDIAAGIEKAIAQLMLWVRAGAKAAA